MSSKDIEQISFEIFQSVDLRVALVLSAQMAEGTLASCRVLRLDLGPMGTRTSVGQYAMIEESDLVGKKVIACCNLGERKMGRYISEVLVLGAPHPMSPAGQTQAIPITTGDLARIGDRIF